ncbi:unnamed protein product [Closterium sp. Yama58-4]|nr:unnamed protein product [Closterium sp. Yama58-4]
MAAYFHPSNPHQVPNPLSRTPWQAGCKKGTHHHPTSQPPNHLPTAAICLSFLFVFFFFFHFFSFFFFSWFFFFFFFFF